MTRKDRIRYTIPEKKIINVRSMHISTPHDTGLTFTSKILVIIRGIATIANFFHILNILSEKMRVNNNEAEMKSGVNTKKGINSSNTQELQV